MVIEKLTEHQILFLIRRLVLLHERMVNPDVERSNEALALTPKRRGRPPKVVKPTLCGDDCSCCSIDTPVPAINDDDKEEQRRVKRKIAAIKRNYLKNKKTEDKK